MYRIELEKQVIKFLKLHQEIAEKFFEKVILMERDPFDARLDVKRMEGTKLMYWRLRI